MILEDTSDSVTSSNSTTSFEEDVANNDVAELFAKLCIIVKAMGWTITFESSTNDGDDDLKGLIIGDLDYIDEILNKLGSSEC